jgi:hypothetical protein
MALKMVLPLVNSPPQVFPVVHSSLTFDHTTADSLSQ